MTYKNLCAVEYKLNQCLLGQIKDNIIEVTFYFDDNELHILFVSTYKELEDLETDYFNVLETLLKRNFSSHKVYMDVNTLKEKALYDYDDIPNLPKLKEAIDENQRYQGGLLLRRHIVYDNEDYG